MRTISFTLGLVLFCSAATHAGATTIAVANYSFEALTLNPGDYYAYNIPGWTFSTFNSTYRPTALEIPGGVPDGTNVAAVGGGNNIYQIVSASLAANTQYTLQVGVGERTDIPAPGYLISLYAGSTLLASDSSQLLISGSFITSTISYFADVNDPALGQALKIVLSVGGDVNQTEFDNVRLDATSGAPEPGTFVMLGLAAMVIGRKRFRRD